MKENHSLQFLGATETVTGSKFLVNSGGIRVLVDCGLYQGVRALRERNWAGLPFDIATLDAIVLTHAHLDHCGYVPRLVAEGYAGPIYGTPGTIELARIVLPDCGHLNEEEAEYANRKGFSRHDPARPLYTEDDAWEAIGQLRPVDYATKIEVAPDMHLRLSRAGHILGAASVEIELGHDGPTVVVSGDLGRSQHPLLVPPDPPPFGDCLLVESTYGNRHHDDAGSLDKLAAAIVATVDRGGSVLIPAFAVDRTEVLLHHLSSLTRSGRLPGGLPIFVDSPMALSALDVYRDAIARGDCDIRPELRGRSDFFDLQDLHEVRDVEGSKALNNPSRPSIVVSAAGMASGGRVVHHLAHWLPDPRNSVILVGFQAVGTRGRQLVDGATELKMMGKYVRVRSQIVNLPMFSVHADASELLAWVGRASPAPETVYVVHGEPEAATALAKAITTSLDLTAVVPSFGELVRVGD
jgi:metallo-beta-lactamase family protein